MLMELNMGGNVNLPQLALGRGLVDEHFRGFLAECGTQPGGQKLWKRLGRRLGIRRGIARPIT
jgi:hypothetical protein